MILNKLYVTVTIAIIYLAIAACGGGDSSGGPVTGSAPVSEPSQSCTAPMLNSPFTDTNSPEQFVVFAPDSPTLEVRVYSDGDNVYFIATEGQTVFGFTGAPLESGSTCALISASADYNRDGAFDEDAANFMSNCSLVGDGSKITLLDGPSSIEASDEFKNGLLILYNQVMFYNIVNPLDCSRLENVSASGLYQSLLTELQTRAGALNL